jgi:arginase
MEKVPSPKIDLIGVPIDLGVRELGLKLGPDTFREMGLVDIARQLGLDVRDVGSVEMPNRPRKGRHDEQTHQILEWCEVLADVVAESVKENRIPICLGGDHSLAIGSLAGVASHVGRVGCVWLDAHPDANTPETSPSGNIHGMPVAIILGHGPEALVNIKRPGAKVASEHLTVLGARDIDSGEEVFLRHNGIQMFTVFDIIEKGLPSVLDKVIERVSRGTDGVHLSLDLDVLHEDIAPGVGLASHCGLDMREATYVCRRLAASCPIISIDLVGLNPVRDRNMRTARIAIELLMTLLGRSFSFNYDAYLRAI